MNASISIELVTTKRDRRAFVDFAWEVYRDDAAWVPPLKAEVHALIDPAKNPWFQHARAALWVARRNGAIVGRISAQVDQLVLAHMQPGLGQWGMFEALDADASAALIAQAERWLREQGMTAAMGPISLSIWDEPGLLIEGFDQPPVAMMGHHRPAYQAWVEAAGYAKAKDLVTYDLNIDKDQPELIKKMVAATERNARVRIRNVDKSKFARDSAIILNLLNDAWSDNWGFVPLTDAEIAYAGKKLKPIIFEDMVRIAELDGEPVGFMLTIPDINEMTRDLNGELFPFGFVKLLWRLRKPKVSRIRVPLMGVTKRLHGTRLGGQIAYTLIEYIRRACVENYGVRQGEFGWVLEDNEGMMSIAALPGAVINHRYRVYQKTL
ncbi:MAG: N-acetyltransferase [Pseudomonadota bacterium]|nr:N-acetyltransferase [Pseudomonadota bacterium]